MTARVLRPAINLVTVGAVIIAALAVYFAMGTGTSHADSRFQPASQTKYCNALASTFPDADLAGAGALNVCTETAGDLATGAHPKTTSILDIPATDLNFAQVVTFSPGTATINTAVPVSAKVGGLHSETRLGLFNGPCNSFTPVDFIFYNVELPNAPSDPRTSTNIAWPRDDGVGARFDAWRLGNGFAPSGVEQTITDGNGDLHADYNTRSILKYPSYLLDAFDTDGHDGVSNDNSFKPILPKAAYGGLSFVVSSWIPLYFLQFDDTGINALAGAGLEGAASLFTSNMGEPNVSVLNDPTSTVVSVSGITDFCSPLKVTTMLLGSALPQPSGASVFRYTNPASAGTVYHSQFAQSLRDADQDGYENAMDTCPKQQNADISRPPTSGGDTDGDGIDNICDSVSSPPLQTDQDGDSYDNRQDTCPLVGNPTDNHADDETNQTQAVAGADLGPKTDSIGDICDTGSTTGAVQNGRPISISFSSTVGNGRYHVVNNVMAKCVGATDADGDGYCQAQDGGTSCGSTDVVILAGGVPPDAIGTCPTGGSCLVAACLVRHAAWTGTNPGRQMDSDGDKVADGVETWLGTDATKPCAQDGTGLNEAPLDNWPLDVRADNGTATTNDITDFAFALNHYIGEVPEAANRIDFNVDGQVTTNDLTGYAAALNKSCGGITVDPVPFPDGPIPAWSQQ